MQNTRIKERFLEWLVLLRRFRDRITFQPPPRFGVTSNCLLSAFQLAADDPYCSETSATASRRADAVNIRGKSMLPCHLGTAVRAR